MAMVTNPILAMAIENIMVITVETMIGKIADLIVISIVQ